MSLRSTGELMSWVAEGSLAMSFLAVTALVIRRLAGPGLDPRWLIAAGWLVMLRPLIPAPLTHRWALESLWKGMPLSSGPARVHSSLIEPPSAPPPAAQQYAEPGNPAAGGTDGKGSKDSAPVGRRERGWLQTVFILWLGGGLIFLVAVLLRHTLFMRRALTGAVPCRLPWPEPAESCARQAGLRRVPEIRMTAGGPAVPFVYGVLRPVILLPEGLTDRLSSGEVRCVLLHEMLHIAKKDVAANWFLTGMRALHWFNPLVHLTCRNLTADREILRDRQVLALLRDASAPADYGRALLKLAVSESRSASPPTVAPLFHSPNELKRRLTMLLPATKPSSLRSSVTAAALLSLAAGLAFADAEPPRAAVQAETPAPPAKPAGGAGRIELIYPENAAEAPGIFQKVAKQEPVSGLRIHKAELLTVYNATDEPLKHRHGSLLSAQEPGQKMEGSHAPRVLAGSAGIMVWGPYAELEKGDYLVVYRFRLFGNPEPGSTVFLDVAHNACTRAGVRLSAEQLTSGEWLEMAVPVSLPEKKKLEYRFWPDGNPAALDRIYVFRVTPRPGDSKDSPAPAENLPAGEPVEGRTDVVTSPHTDDRGMIDVSGMAPGTRVRCPYTGKDFRTP